MMMMIIIIIIITTIIIKQLHIQVTGYMHHS